MLRLDRPAPPMMLTSLRDRPRPGKRPPGRRAFGCLSRRVSWLQLAHVGVAIRFDRLIAPLAFADNSVVAHCDNCGAAMRVDRGRGLLVCDHCGGEQELPALVEGLELLSETSTLCPICSTHLSNSRLEGHPLLCCARCFGMLIDMNRFVTVIEAVRCSEARSFRSAPPRRQNPGDRLLDCPACGQPMVGHLYGGPGNVVIDTCERCLVNWLDAGELHRIAAAPD